jgi:hypothetical protein
MKAKEATIDDAKPILFDAFSNGGSLVPITGSKEIPFDINRIFYVWDVPDKEVRGKHAHYECNQIIICLHGRLKVLLDDGKERKIQTLSGPRQGLLVPAGIWAAETYLDDAVMLVLCSHEYSTEDYIHSYEKFVKWKTAI